MSNTFARLLGGVWPVVWCCCAALPGLAQMPAPGGEGAAAVDGEAAGEPAAEPAIQPRALMTDAEAEAMFKQAFGEELREVESSRDNTDDVEFAQTLLRGARGMVESPKVRQIACLKALELGLRRAEGFEIAEQALEMIHQFEQADEQTYSDVAETFSQAYLSARTAQKTQMLPLYFEVLIRLGDMRLDTGDAEGALEAYRRAMPFARASSRVSSSDLNNRLRAAAVKQRVNDRIDQLDRRLLADPDNKVLAGELALLYAGERDNPTQGMLYASLIGDKELERMLDLTQRDPTLLNETELFELGAWLESQASNLSDSGKRNFLERAKDVYETFLSSRNVQDALQFRARTASEDIVKQLDRLAPSDWRERETTAYRRGLKVSYFEDWDFSRHVGDSVLTRSVHWTTRPEKWIRRHTFACVYVGQIYIKTPGNYTFRLYGDDKAQLWINRRSIARSNKAIAEGTVKLTKGYHDIEMHAFQGHDNAALTLTWRTPEMEPTGRATVPGEVLFHRVK